VSPRILPGRVIAHNQTELNWHAATDAGGSGIAGYKVYRDSTLISGSNPITALAYTDNTVAANTTYSYTLKAVDNASNESSATPAVQLTTPVELAFQDDFNRTNSTGLGSNYTTASGTWPQWNVSSSKAACASTRCNSFRSSLSVSSFNASVYLPGPSYWGGIAFWHTSGGEYRVFISAAYLHLSYYHYGSQTETFLHADPMSGATLPGTLVVEAISSTRRIRIWYGGTLRLDITDTETSRNNSGSIGLYGYNNMLADDIIVTKW
jgi:hypothetical protein